MDREKYQQIQNIIKSSNSCDAGGLLNCQATVKSAENHNFIRRILNKTASLFKNMFGSRQAKQQKPEQIPGALNASRNRTPVITLVYHDSNIDHPTSETFNHDKMLVNAKQILVTMDHTTASRH